MQKTTLLLAVALAFSASSWGQDVKINGTGVSLEANKTPIHTAKNPQAIALLPQDLHLAVPGKFTVAVAALNSPPLTVFADDNKTLLGSEADIARLVAESLGLEVNVVPTSWEDWPLGVTSGKYDAAISNITVTKERKEKFDFATYRKDSLGFYVKSTSPLSKIEIDQPDQIASESGGHRRAADYCRLRHQPGGDPAGVERGERQEGAEAVYPGLHQG